MTDLEEDMRDLHLSLDSTIKSPTRFSPRPLDCPSQQLTEYVPSDTLDLSRRRLKDIPNHVLTSNKLKNLYLEGNEISSLPNSIFSSLPNLVWLDLRNNQLTCLPSNIGEHRCLKSLLLEGNPITELPVELGSVITLRALSLRNCPVSFPPQDVLQQGLAHILHFLRCSALAQRPLTAPSTLPDSDMPAVERLPLSEVLQSSVDLCEEEEDDGEVQRFKELRQRMIQMERADLGQETAAVPPLPHHGADRCHKTYSLSTIKRTQESMTRTFPEVPLSDVLRREGSEKRKVAAMKMQKEKQALLDQKRKDEELLQEWRNQARILQERKMLEYKQDKRERDRRDKNILHDTAAQNGPQKSLMADKETEQARVARAQNLEHRIRNHVKMMQERRSRPKGSPAEEAQAALKEMEEVKQMQLELAKSRRQREQEYRFSAFTGETSPGFGEF